MTTMVANATRVAAVAQDATRLLGLRSPGERAADAIATKRRHGQSSPGGLPIPVRGQALSYAVEPGAGAGSGNPMIALLDQPGFVAPGLVGNPGPSGVGGGPDVAVADLPPPAFTPGGLVVIGGGGSAGGSAGGGGSTGGTTSTGGTGSSSTGGDGATSTGGTTTTSGGTTSSTGGSTTSGGTDPNVPAVPEPSTWLMMLAGFAAIGTALRRAVRHAPARGA